MAEARNLGLFPFCVPLGPPMVDFGDGPVVLPVGQGTFYPILMPIEDAIKMWWRVKDWQFSFDYYYYEEIDDGGSGSYAEVLQTSLSTRISQIAGTSTPATRMAIQGENYLVCETDPLYAGITTSDWQPQVTQNFVITDDPETPFDETNSGSFSRIATTMGWNQGPFQTGEAPPLFVYSDDTFKNVWMSNDIRVGAASSSKTNGEFVTNVQLILQDSIYTIPIYQFIFDPEIPQSPWLGEVTNITIQPAEWWPYDPLDGGGPIYDSATGAVLRPDYVGLS